MPQPTASDVHVDAPLTNVSVAYIQRQDHFIAAQVFPVVPVEKQSDKYFTYTKADWFRDEAEVRASGTESAGSGYGLSTTTYFCDTYALHKDIDDHTRANSDAALNPDRDATQFITQRLLLRQEIQWVAEAFVTSVWGTTSTPANKWSSYTTSDPITDIETGINTILSATRFMPNTMVFGYNTWRYLKHHPDLVDRFKYTTSESVTTDMVARLFGLDRILVAKAIRNTSAEGATAAYAFTHGNHALLAYVNPSPGLLAPSAGYTFRWTGVSEGLGTDIAFRRIRMDHLRSDRVEGEVAFDFKLVGTDLGYLFLDAVS